MLNSIPRAQTAGYACVSTKACVQFESMCRLHAGPRVAGQTLLDLDAVTLQTPDGRSTLVQSLSVKVGAAISHSKFADGLISDNENDHDIDQE